MRTSLVCLALALLIGAAPAAAQTDLQLTAGTMQVGGYGTININTVMPDGGDSVTGTNLSISPQFGYFIVDQVELLAGARLGIGFGDLYSTADRLVTFFVGGRYFLPLGLPVPAYVGLDVGMGFNIPPSDDTTRETTKGLELAVPIGVLIPLNAHVALDVGVRPAYALSLQDGGTDQLLVPIGYFGVQSFF